MFSAISLLVLGCAITINAQGPAQCGEATIGVVPTSHGVKLPPVRLDPSIAVWRITIPPVPECVYGVSGVHAYMCDDVAPTGYFIDFNSMVVNRVGNLLGYGTVTITVYCIV